MENVDQYLDQTTAAKNSPADSPLEGLQFTHAEISKPASPAVTKNCVVCSHAIDGGYFQLGTSELCPDCAAKWQEGQTAPTKNALARGVLYGFGAAMAGAVLIAVVSAVTGYRISLVSIAVGWMVARAFLKGTRGLSARRCQWLAVALAYFGITMSILPELIQASMKIADKARKAAVTASNPVANNSSDVADSTATAGSATHSDIEPVKAKTARRPVRWGLLFFGFFLTIGLGLVSPLIFLVEGISGIINAVILFLGLRQAWRMMASDPRVLTGPLNPGSISEVTPSAT